METPGGGIPEARAADRKGELEATRERPQARGDILAKMKNAAKRLVGELENLDLSLAAFRLTKNLEGGVFEKGRKRDLDSGPRHGQGTD